MTSSSTSSSAATAALQASNAGTQNPKRPSDLHVDLNVLLLMPLDAENGL
jgi:hypothetical protein